MGFLDDYEPVEDRLRAFWSEHPEGRITTEMVKGEAGEYVVKASVWRVGGSLLRYGGWSKHMNELQDGDEVEGGSFYRPVNFPPDATGYAQEQISDKGVNSTSALENCETSAIGRALANLGYAAKGKRPSREEMSKSAPAMEASADAGGRVDTASSASRESSAMPEDYARQLRGESSGGGGAPPHQSQSSSPPGQSSEGTAESLGEGGSEPPATPEPGEGSGHPASTSPGKGTYPLSVDECDHKTRTGRWLPTRIVHGQAVCPRCGLSAIKFRETA